jgi:hypothetical protein
MIHGIHESEITGATDNMAAYDRLFVSIEVAYSFLRCNEFAIVTC